MAVHRSRQRAPGGGGASFQVTGTERLASLASSLRAVGDRELMRLLYRAINSATKDAKAAVRRSAETKLPKRGGLARRVARGKIVTKRRLSNNAANVSLVATSNYDIRLMNRGEVRHPLYGNREWWYSQSVPKAKGWWSDTLVDQAPNVRKRLEVELSDVAKKLQASVGGKT